MNENGTFIIFEGSDGCGKSSMVDEVRRHFEAKGVEAIFVQDPGGTDIGAQIRKILLDPENAKMCAMTELLLYVASRAQLVSEVIRPALREGKVVVSDRFILSTLVYQGGVDTLDAAGISEKQLEEIVHLGLPRNDDLPVGHIILLDVPPDISMERVGSDRDRMEQKGEVFFEEVRERYLIAAEAFPPKQVTVVDASRSILEVKKEVLGIVDALVG